MAAEITSLLYGCEMCYSVQKTHQISLVLSHEISEVNPDHSNSVIEWLICTLYYHWKIKTHFGSYYDA